MASLNKYAPWALAITLALGGSCGVAQAAYVDVLDLPAEPSALAVHSALRDVVQLQQRHIAADAGEKMQPAGGAGGFPFLRPGQDKLG